MSLPQNVLDVLIKRELPAKETEKIDRAYEFAKNAHGGQKRFSGEPYFNHIVRVFLNLASFGVDSNTLIAGLLHDIVEDCKVSPEAVEKEFGKDVSGLVRGVSKLGTIKYKGRERYAENLRHLFIATAEDARVILIKLADRLDNIRTLTHVPKHKQERIAIETLQIYAPIANRLGMNRLKTELEDTAFPYVDAGAYEKVRVLIKERESERKKYIEKVRRSLLKKLSEEDMRDIHMEYRIKGYYSIYRKLLRHDMDEDSLYDIYALRVVVPKIEDCYRVLGIIHGMWKPLPGRIKDYIANPKLNGYQSLHTTVFTGDGGIAEIQVRTEEMHKEAEFGIAAHLIYKEHGVTKKTSVVKKQLTWLSRVRDVHDESEEPEDFLNNLTFDFFHKRIFVFTPQGDVIELPQGASALDFAYSIHSDIGNHTSGAKINGKFVSLDRELKSGDIVEIETKKSGRPTRKWIDYAKTTLARKHIRAGLRVLGDKKPRY